MMQMKAQSFMYVNVHSLQVTDVNDPDALEFVHLFLKGQSFLYNQIRKMVGSMIQVFHGMLDREII
jgi:tRNA U38,U39,U40 pseudouridine synthase TruA